MSQDRKYDELVPTELDNRTRYQLLTSSVVPRPIGWLGTYAADGTANLAPFSYFAALAASPMLIGVSIGHRREGPKDTLVNIRGRGAFTANVVTGRQLEAMNETSGDYPPHVSEFAAAGLEPRPGSHVDAPWVQSCPVVMECHVFDEVDLGDAPNTLIIGEVALVRVDRQLPRMEGTWYLDSGALDPVGRLSGSRYTALGEIIDIPRPRVSRDG